MKRLLVMTKTRHAQMVLHKNGAYIVYSRDRNNADLF